MWCWHAPKSNTPKLVQTSPAIDGEGLQGLPLCSPQIWHSAASSDDRRLAHVFVCVRKCCMLRVRDMCYNNWLVCNWLLDLVNEKNNNRWLRLLEKTACVMVFSWLTVNQLILYPALVRYTCRIAFYCFPEPPQQQDYRVGSELKCPRE